MESGGGGGGGGYSWPQVIRNRAHPQRELHLLLYYGDFCNLCGGALAGKLGYYCTASRFNFHCECLINSLSSLPTMTGVLPRGEHPLPPYAPRPYVHPAPPYAPYPQYHYPYGYVHYLPPAPPVNPIFNSILNAGAAEIIRQIFSRFFEDGEWYW